MIESHKNLCRFLALCSAVVFTTACVKGPGFLKQSGSEEKGASENIFIVPTTINGEFATGKVTAIFGDTQIIQAADGSTVEGSEASFPPGSIAIDTDVTIGPGENFVTDGLVTDLDLGSGVESAGGAVSVESSEPSDAASPFTIALPMPASASLVAGADPFANLVVIYKIIKQSNGAEFTGVMTRNQLTIEGAFVRLSTLYFGDYQAVITTIPVTAPIEQIVPPKSLARKTYFRPGFVTTTFDLDLPEQDGFRGWFLPITKARVGAASTLSMDVLAKPVSGE